MSVFESKKPGHCAICDKDYPIGTRITKDKGGYVMADCKWPEHAKTNANPITQGAGKQAGRLAGGPAPADAEATTGSGMKKGEGAGSLSIQPASSLTDAQIEAAIAWAEKKAAEHLNMELDYADIAFLEYFRAYAEFARQKQQQEFSLAMSRSIQTSAQANIEKVDRARR